MNKKEKAAQIYAGALSYPAKMNKDQKLLGR